MALLAVCEDHPRRTRGLSTFTYVDADGIEYVTHYCDLCTAEELEDEWYDWQPAEGGYRFEQPRTEGTGQVLKPRVLCGS